MAADGHVPAAAADASSPGPGSSRRRHGHRLRLRLQQLVEKVDWAYAVLWELSPDFRNVVWGDGYYNGLPSSLPMPWAQRAARRQVVQEVQESWPGLAQTHLGSLSTAEWFFLTTANLSFSLGAQGTPGQTMMSGTYDWMCDAGAGAGANHSDSPLHFTRAKAAGIKTVLWVATHAGVVEMGSIEEQAEDIFVVELVRDAFSSSSSSSGAAAGAGPAPAPAPAPAPSSLELSAVSGTTFCSTLSGTGADSAYTSRLSLSGDMVGEPSTSSFTDAHAQRSLDEQLQEQLSQDRMRHQQHHHHRLWAPPHFLDAGYPDGDADAASVSASSHGHGHQHRFQELQLVQQASPPPGPGSSLLTLEEQEGVEVYPRGCNWRDADASSPPGPLDQLCVGGKRAHEWDAHLGGRSRKRGRSGKRSRDHGSGTGTSITHDFMVVRSCDKECAITDSSNSAKWGAGPGRHVAHATGSGSGSSYTHAPNGMLQLLSSMEDHLDGHQHHPDPVPVPMPDPESEEALGLAPDMEVRMVDADLVVIKLHSRNRPGLFDDIMCALQELRVQVREANMGSVVGTLLQEFTAKVHISFAQMLTTEVIAAALHLAVERGNRQSLSPHSHSLPIFKHMPSMHSIQSL